MPTPAESIATHSPVLGGAVGEIVRHINQFQFEGIVAKRIDSIYVPGEEPGTWQKHKIQQTEDFLIGGFIPGARGVDEILVGRREGKRLLFVESIRNGFVPSTKAKVFEAIGRTMVDDCPFSNLPEKRGAHRMDREKMKKVRWVKPTQVVEVAFNEVTSSGHLRHSRFLRLRDTNELRSNRNR